MAERDNIIPFPLDRVKPATPRGEMGKLIPFPNRMIPSDKEKIPVRINDSFEYRGVSITSPDWVFYDERVMIDGMPLAEYETLNTRGLLDKPNAYTAFLDNTAVRVFDAHCARIGQRMNGQEKKQAYRKLAMYTLNKADSMETAQRLRDSVIEMLKVVYGSARAAKMLERRELERDIASGTGKTAHRSRPHSHFRVVK